MSYPAGFWPPGSSAADSVDLSAVQFSINTLEEQVLKVKKYGIGTETITDFASHVGGQILSVTKNDAYDEDASYCANVICNVNGPRQSKQVLMVAPDQNVSNFLRPTQTIRFINSIYDENDDALWHAFEVISS